MAITALQKYGFDWAERLAGPGGMWADPRKWLIKRCSSIHIQGDKPNIFIHRFELDVYDVYEVGHDMPTHRL